MSDFKIIKHITTRFFILALIHSVAFNSSIALAQNNSTTSPSSSANTSKFEPSPFEDYYSPLSRLNPGEYRCDQPLAVSTGQRLTSEDGSKTLDIENTVIVAETAEQAEAAKLWFLKEAQQAKISGADISTLNVALDDPYLQHQSLLMQNAYEDLSVGKHATFPVKKSLWEKTKLAAGRFASQFKTGAARWVKCRPFAYRLVFAVTRGAINGALSSYVFANYFLDGTTPTWLALATGMSLGLVSFSLNFFSHKYAAWIDRGVEHDTFNTFKKFFPFLTREKMNELKSVLKWSGIEVLFLGFPYLFFYYLPQIFDQGDGYTLASSWLAGFLASAASFVGSFSQYPWEKGIARAKTSDFLHAADVTERNWVLFRTSLMFMSISILQVPITALSLGDYKLTSYAALGFLGIAGLVYRHKTITRSTARELDQKARTDDSAPKNCADYLKAEKAA